MDKLNKLIQSNQFYLNKDRSCLCDETLDMLMDIQENLDCIQKDIENIDSEDRTKLESNILIMIKNL